MSDTSLPEVPGIERMRLLDEGGFGSVYVGWEPDNSREVAVKVIRVVGPVAEAARRFERERQSMGRLSDHASIVPLYRSGALLDGRWFLIMPYYANGSLQGRLSSGPVSAEDAVRIGVQVADALAYAHQLAVIHGDVKPANIMLGRIDGQVRLADFGIAHLFDRQTSMQAHSPGYSSPEQRWGYGVTPASDVWSLGATLYALITSFVPPEPSLDPPAPSNPDVAASVAAALRRGHHPAELVSIIERCMQRDPALRPDARMLHGLLLRIAGPPAAPPVMQVPLAAPTGGSGSGAGGFGWDDATAPLPGPARTDPGRDDRRPAPPPGVPISSTGRTGDGHKIAYGVAAGAVAALLGIGGFVLVKGGGSGADSASSPTVSTAPADDPITSTSRSTTTSSTTTSSTTSTTTSSTTTTPPSSVPPRNLPVVGISASAVSDPATDAGGNPVSYQPSNAVDGQPATAWRPSEFQSVGHFLVVDLGGNATVTRVGLLPGYAKVDATSGQNWFTTLRRIRQVVWTFDGGQQIQQSFDTNSPTVQYVTVPALQSRAVKVEIRDATAHGGLDFVAISELQVWGS